MSNRMKSRKLWAWIVWTILLILTLIFKFEISDAWVYGYTLVTILFIGGQAAVDVAKALKGE